MTTPLDPGPWLGQPEPEPVFQSAPAPAAEPEPETGPSVPRRRPRRVLFIALLTVGVLLIAGGAATLFRELTRKATPAEANAALQQEIATRWERLTAGKIFPATVSYTDSDGNATSARLVGIAPAASCQTSLEPAAYALVRGLGCATMLRATYVDASGALATTVGIAVMPSTRAARLAAGDAVSLAPGDGLHAMTFAGTVSGQFGDAARGIQGGLAGGPYVFLFTAGFTDGLPTTAAAQQQTELQSFGDGVGTGLKVLLTGHGKPCTMKDIKC
jgi:hypothetical protein